MMHGALLPEMPSTHTCPSAVIIMFLVGFGVERFEERLMFPKIRVNQKRLRLISE